MIIAYEPVWAIGTGRTPQLLKFNNIHQKIRIFTIKKIGSTKSQKISILYGGSVTLLMLVNIELNQVDGALVGGASLKSKDFVK